MILKIILLMGGKLLQATTYEVVGVFLRKYLAASYATYHGGAGVEGSRPCQSRRFLPFKFLWFEELSSTLLFKTISWIRIFNYYCCPVYDNQFDLPPRTQTVPRFQYTSADSLPTSHSGSATLSTEDLSWY